MPQFRSRKDGTHYPITQRRHSHTVISSDIDPWKKRREGVLLQATQKEPIVKRGSFGFLDVNFRDDYKGFLSTIDSPTLEPNKVVFYLRRGKIAYNATGVVSGQNYLYMVNMPKTSIPSSYLIQISYPMQVETVVNIANERSRFRASGPGKVFRYQESTIEWLPNTAKNIKGATRIL